MSQQQYKDLLTEVTMFCPPRMNNEPLTEKPHTGLGLLSFRQTGRYVRQIDRKHGFALAPCLVGIERFKP